MNYAIKQWACVGLAVACMWPHAALGADNPACAVVGVDAGPGLHDGISGLLANRLSQSAARMRVFDVVARSTINRKLRTEGFNRNKYGGSRAAAVDAGRILGADYVIYGIAKLRDDEYILSTALLRVRDAVVVDRAAHAYRASLSSFLESAPQHNIDRLFKTFMPTEPEPAPDTAGDRAQVADADRRTAPRKALEPEKAPAPPAPIMPPEPEDPVTIAAPADPRRPTPDTTALPEPPERAPPEVEPFDPGALDDARTKRVPDPDLPAIDDTPLAEPPPEVVATPAPLVDDDAPAATGDKIDQPDQAADDPPAKTEPLAEPPPEVVATPAPLVDNDAPVATAGKSDQPDQATDDPPAKTEPRDEFPTAVPQHEIRAPDAATELRIDQDTEPIRDGQLPPEPRPTEIISDSDAGFWGSLHSKLHNRIEFGLRTSSYSLLDTTSGEVDEMGNLTDSFLGTINQLEETGSTTLQPYLNVIINRNFLLELQLEKIEMRTITISGKSDGSLTLDGPVLSIVGCYPNPTEFTPYAGMGLAFLNASFAAQPHWALGYSGPEEWIALGMPTELNRGRERKLTAQDDTGLMASVGCVWQFARDWAAEAYARYLSAESQAHFSTRVHGDKVDKGEGSFPVDSILYGIGVRYAP